MENQRFRRFRRLGRLYLNTSGLIIVGLDLSSSVLIDQTFARLSRRHFQLFRTSSLNCRFVIIFVLVIKNTHFFVFFLNLFFEFEKTE